MKEHLLQTPSHLVVPWNLHTGGKETECSSQEKNHQASQDILFQDMAKFWASLNMVMELLVP